jgi:hypothetical protein
MLKTFIFTGILAKFNPLQGIGNKENTGSERRLKDE